MAVLVVFVALMLIASVLVYRKAMKPWKCKQQGEGARRAPCTWPPFCLYPTRTLHSHRAAVVLWHIFFRQFIKITPDVCSSHLNPPLLLTPTFIKDSSTSSPKRGRFLLKGWIKYGSGLGESPAESGIRNLSLKGERIYLQMHVWSFFFNQTSWGRLNWEKFY